MVDSHVTVILAEHEDVVRVRDAGVQQQLPARGMMASVARGVTRCAANVFAAQLAVWCVGAGLAGHTPRCLTKEHTQAAVQHVHAYAQHRELGAEGWQRFGGRDNNSDSVPDPAQPTCKSQLALPTICAPDGLGCNPSRHAPCNPHVIETLEHRSNVPSLVTVVVVDDHGKDAHGCGRCGSRRW